MNQDFMSIAQTATLLGVSEITVKRFIREKLIHAEDQNGELMLLKEAVNRYKEIHDRMNKR